MIKLNEETGRKIIVNLTQPYILVDKDGAEIDYDEFTNIQECMEEIQETVNDIAEDKEYLEDISKQHNIPFKITEVDIDDSLYLTFELNGEYTSEQIKDLVLDVCEGFFDNIGGYYLQSEREYDDDFDDYDWDIFSESYEVYVTAKPIESDFKLEIIG